MISVIIPTYKEPEVLDICLSTAIKHQDSKNQIIVVVDGFIDINKPVLDKYEGHIEILNIPSNVGLNRATNFGVYAAEFDNILIVNDDNVFPEHWDTRLLEHDVESTVVTPNQIEPKPSIFPSFVIKSFGDPGNFDTEGFVEFEKTISNTEADTAGSTLPIYMSKQNYMMLGGWDEAYPGHWVTDLDFFYKCKLAGLDFKRIYGIHFYHFVSWGAELTPAEEASKLEKEEACHNYFKYKWSGSATRLEDYSVCVTS